MNNDKTTASKITEMKGKGRENTTADMKRAKEKSTIGEVDTALTKEMIEDRIKSFQTAASISISMSAQQVMLGRRMKKERSRVDIVSPLQPVATKKPNITTEG